MKYSGPKLITGVESEAITLDKARLFCKIIAEESSPSFQHPDDDLVTSLITAARLAIENEIQRPIGVQTYEVGFPGWLSKFEFPRPPLLSLVSIKYTLQDGTVTTLVDSEESPPVTTTIEYDLDTAGELGALYLRSGSSWPSDTLGNGYPVRIRYTAGYSSIPEPLIVAMKQMIAHLYINRPAVELGSGLTAIEIPMGVKFLINPYKFEVFG